MRMAYDESGNRVRDVSYIYDAMNRLERVKNDDKNLNMDEFFAYDAQGRIVQQLRGSNASEPASKSDAGKYAYIENTNMLKSVSDGMGESADKRSMADGENFVYDRDGNLTADHSKYMTIAYDWRGMPVEFKRLDKCYDIHEQIICDSVKLDIAYDGAGRRISKTSLRKNVNSDDWTLEQITHYTGIGSEIRKEYHNGELQSTKVVVNMPQGLGRYGIENADGMAKGDEFYLKNHLGSTMMVAQVSSTNASEPAKVAAAYDYRAFGEQVTLKKSADKVTENFTGKELDDETELDYFGARYLDPMLGMWTSVDPKRQFASPYLYAGNGYNPVGAVDPDGNLVDVVYNRATGSLTATDRDSKQSISGQYFSGGDYPILGHFDKIPVGKYEILEQAQKDQWYRLEGKDGLRDDYYQGRSSLRWHPKGPAGVSKGCVTAEDNDVHALMDKMLQNTTTENVEDEAFYPKSFGQQIKDFFMGESDNTLKKYGEFEVIDE